jgi:PAS domain S-box-containing protein
MSTTEPKDLSQALFEESGDALFLFDPDSDRILQVSRVAEQLTGFSRPELLRMEATTLFRMSGKEGRSGVHQAAAHTGIYHSKEGYFLRTRDPSVWIPVNVSISRLHVLPRTLALITARDVRERHEAQARMQRVEEELRRVLASVSDCLWSGETATDGLWIYRYVSPVVQTLTGRPAGEFLGPARLWEVIVHADDRVRWLRAAERLHAGLPTQEEYRVVWPDGQVRWLRESVRVSRRSDGQSWRLDGVLTDITDRKNAEEERDRFFTLSLDLLCIAGYDGYFKRINPAFERVLGYSTPELLAEPFLTFVHPEDRQATLGAMADITAGKDLISFENRYRARNGSYRWFLWTAVPYPREQLIYAAARDITERKQTEEALARERKLLRALMDHLPDHIFIKDRQSRFVTANLATLQTLGASLKRVIGKTDFDFLPAEQAEQFYRSEQEVLQSGRPLINYEEQLVERSGKVRWLLTTKLPLRDRDGAIVGLVGMSHDITDRKLLETEWRRAKEAAEAASRAKSEFLARMSHEIRTPMNGILGNAELALDTELTREQRECLQTVKSSADALLRVINDILDFSKIEAGKLQLEEAPFPLRDSLDDTVRALGLRAQQKGLELVCHVAPDVPDHLIGDLGRLRQVLVNLVGNAIKFTENGEVVVRVSREDQRAQQPVVPAAIASPLSNHATTVRAHFEVIDTGIGISHDKQQRIFEPFEQADGSTTRRYGGSGLGLAISAQLVGLMGGQLTVDSEVGKGSRFRFTAQFGVTEPGAGIEADLHGLPVLVVDDNAVTRQTLLEMLTSWRLRPRAMASAEDALVELKRAAGRSEPYRLVIIDSVMPQSDGFALASEVRAHPELAGATIMLLVSAEHTDTAGRARQAGAQATVFKPVKHSELLNTIQHVLVGPGPTVIRPPPQPVASPTRPLHVLLAEDNLVNQRLAVRMLEKRGHRVTVVGSGKEAVTALEGQSFDLVLMDLEMPEMGGFEATAAIRDRERLSGQHTPIIALTAHAMKGDRERCLAGGMDGYVAKPILAQDLQDAINAVFPPPSSPEPAPDAVPQPAVGLPMDAVDFTTALDHVAGDVGLLRELAGIFLTECGGMLASVDHALAAGDATRLKRAAHMLKGAVGAFGASKAFDAAARLEQMGGGGSGDSAAAVADLHQAIEQVRQVLGAFVDGSITPGA